MKKIGKKGMNLSAMYMQDDYLVFMAWSDNKKVWLVESKGQTEKFDTYNQARLYVEQSGLTPL
jgi:hypothetical protein